MTRRGLIGSAAVAAALPIGTQAQGRNIVPPSWINAKDVPTYHVNAQRLGLNSQFSIPSNGRWQKYATMPSNVIYAAPLYLDFYTFASGPHSGETHNIVLIADVHNTIALYSGDRMLAGNMIPLWSQVVVATSGITIGIHSTPVIDRFTAKIYVVCGRSDGTYGIYQLSLDTGATTASASLTDAGAAGRPSFRNNSPIISSAAR